MRRPVLIAGPLLAVLLVAGGCSDEDSSTTTTAKPSPTTVRPQPSASLSPTRVLNADLQYSTFAKVWDTSGRKDRLDGLKELTVLAPSNTAMDALPAAERERLTTDAAAAAAFVDRYTVERKLGVNDLINLKEPVATVDGTRITATLPQPGGDGAVQVNGAPITTADIQTRNGYVQVLGGLFPSS